jgi:hypothetical protein
LRIAGSRQIAIIRRLSPAQRLQQAMRELLAAGYRARHPTWTETEIRRAVADRVLHACTG